MADVTVSRVGRAVLRSLNLTVNAGDSIAVTGPSGSGKSTLMNVACGLLTPDSGSVTLSGQNLDDLTDRDRAHIRLTKLGIVFQFGDLLSELTLKENVELPMRFARRLPSVAIGRQASQLLDEFNIGHLADRRPDQVSGGERQRAGVARALANSPTVVLADEPTGSLDPAAAENAVGILLTAVRQRQAAMIMVTHNLVAAARCDRSYQLEHGRLTHVMVIPEDAR